jgi:hypothetical protein
MKFKIRLVQKQRLTGDLYWELQRKSFFRGWSTIGTFYDSKEKATARYEEFLRKGTLEDCAILKETPYFKDKQTCAAWAKIQQ